MTSHKHGALIAELALLGKGHLLYGRHASLCAAGEAPSEMAQAKHAAVIAPSCAWKNDWQMARPVLPEIRCPADHDGIRPFLADWVSTAADSWRLAWWQATRAGVACGGRGSRPALGPAEGLAMRQYMWL